MHVAHLSLRDFRSYQQLELDMTVGNTLLYGPNAAGKTSLLEALFYLATTRSPRTSADHELVRWGASSEAGVLPFARIAADVAGHNNHTRLEVLVQLRREETPTSNQPYRSHGAAHKIVRINRKQSRVLDLVGQLRVVLFTPSDLVLVNGPPAERRRYLDITLSQLDPHYVRTLARYNKLVQQRNSLLRAWRERRRPPRGIDDELGYWDSELVASGSYLLAERLRAVADLHALVGPIFCTISGTDQPLAIDYRPSFALDEARDVDSLARQFTAQLQQLRRDELQRGQTLIGPHRDDLLFRAGAIDLGTYGSRGQQRSVTLALKLAEARLMEQRSGTAPVLLLDDLLSELDMQRRSHLLHAIARPHQQTLLTATDLGNFEADFLAQTTCLRVEAGQIYPL